MNEDEIDLLVASASPISEQRVADIPLAGSESDLSEAIMSIPALLADAPVAPLQERPRRSRKHRALTPVAALVALLVGVAGFQQLNRSSGTAWAAPAVAVANAAPRILVALPGWTASRADEFTAARGETTFTDSRKELYLHWRPADQHDDFVNARSAEATEGGSLEVAGHDARLFQYNGPVGPTPSPAPVTAETPVAPPAPTAPADGAGDFTTLWVQGRNSVEVRGIFDDAESYKSVLAGLHEVGVDTWLQAMATSHHWPVLVDMASEGAYSSVVWELADAMAADAPVSGGKPLTIRESYVTSLGCAPR